MGLVLREKKGGLAGRVGRNYQHTNYGRILKNIQTKLNEKSKIDSIKNTALQKLWTVYTNDLREKTLSEQYIKMQNNVYFTQNQPVKEILSGFLGYLKANGYSSRVVANT